MDIPKDFTTIEGIIKCGLYYIETYNIFPFRGCGWYSHPIVEYGLKHNLITLGEIKLEFIPSYTLPANHFVKHINILMNAFKVESTILKNAPNSLIGLFGRTKRTSSKVKYTQSIEEASLWWGEKDPKMNVFIENIKLDNDEVIYKGIFTENVEVEGMKYPIYKQVLEMEALQLHTLENIIINKKGVILDRNTDAIRYARKEPINISDYFWNDEKTVLKYHNEVVKPLKCEVLPRMCRKHQLDYNIFNLQWNIQYDYDGTAQEEAKRIIDTNQSIHINGRAGTGKTYLVNKVIDELKARGKICKGFSPTNKGARLIGGNTIHSLYFKFKSNKKGLFRMIEKEKLEYIFIDEVSMMIKDFYQLFILIKRAFNNIKFIIAGDYGQLPPVKDNWSGDYENSPAMFNLCDGNKINLTTCRRADNELYNLCYDVNSIDIKRFKPTEKTYLNIAYTHRTRININRECMERYLSNNVNQSVSIPKDKENPKTQDVYLTKGMPIIAHKTDKNKNILNSQTFTITNITNEIIKYKDDKTEYSLSVNEFHKYFYLGFCITIHASQGETFNTKYTIYDWEITPFCNKAKYVAMSRSTDINNIQIAQE